MALAYERSMEMKVLVYGSGVIGRCLAHVLCSAGNDVTVPARGSMHLSPFESYAALYARNRRMVQY